MWRSTSPRTTLQGINMCSRPTSDTVSNIVRCRQLRAVVVGLAAFLPPACLGEIAAAVLGVGVVGAQNAGAIGQGLLVQVDRLGIPRHPPVVGGEVATTCQGVR